MEIHQANAEYMVWNYSNWNSDPYNNTITITLNNLLEIELPNEETFLIVKETLTRMGMAAKNSNTLYQSCHILSKQKKYFLTHFKELFMLDGKSASFSKDDRARRNTIAELLQKWKLIKIIYPFDGRFPVLADSSQIKIIPFKEKNKWVLTPKYTVGKYKKKTV